MANMEMPPVRHVDLESLLWDMRDILRGLSQVTKAQAAEIERLGGTPWEGARELQERAGGAVASCDAALAEWDEEESESSFGGRVDVAAWLEATRQLAAEELDAGDHTGDLSFASANSSFWRPEGFNWADEPATDEENSMNPVPDLLHDLDSPFDSASDSDGSFLSADFLGCGGHGHESEAGETACNADEVLVLRPSRRYSFSDAARAGFDLAEQLASEKLLDPDTPKQSSIPFPTLPKAAERLRKINRIESLPNMLTVRDA